VRLALVLAFVSLPAQTPGPPALAVGKDCFDYATTHTLVRNDVLSDMDAAEENLPKCETALAGAQRDLQAMAEAFDKLQAQKTQLVQHIELLEGLLRREREACAARDENFVEKTWEWVDAPLAFAAGTGTCIGVAWGLTQATR